MISACGGVMTDKQDGWRRQRLSASRMTLARRCAAIGALLCLGLLGGLDRWPKAQELAALTAALFLVTAALCLLAESRVGNHQLRSVPAAPPLGELLNRTWLAPATTALIVQSWYGLGSASIAGGDLAPPNGTAWLHHLFSPWAYGGTSLGGPSANQTFLPWAILLRATEAAHLPAAFAERMWSTAMFSLAALSMAVLLRLLARSNAASILGALVFCLNPYVVTVVGANPLYLAMLALVPLTVATVFAVGRGFASVKAGILILGGTAPFVGYLFANPPLTIVVLTAEVVGVAICAVTLDRKSAAKAMCTATAGVALMLVLSSYWILPSFLQARGAAITSLSASSSWTWTETRATLANAYWLNTTWAWLPPYFSYARWYSEMPLAVLRYGPAFVACSALIVVPAMARRLARGVALTALLTMFVLVLSTGTRFPGRIIFDVLYRLPLGWLLREPGRFLVFAVLGLAALTAVAADVVVEALVGHYQSISKKTWARLGGMACVSLLAMGAGFPEYSGLLAQSPKRAVYTQARVSVPKDWLSIARIANQDPETRTLLLPLTRYYQLGYKWGYYGTDGFVENLFENGLDPNPQGYFPSESELLDATKLLAQAILVRDWTLVGDLAGVLNVGQILVRSDIATETLESPQDLLGSLGTSPLVEKKTWVGSLTLFELNREPLNTNIVTVDSDNPDLRLLSELPTGSVLASTPPIPGRAAIYEPPISDWRLGRGKISVSVPALATYRYQQSALPSDRLSLPSHLGERAPAWLKPAGTSVTATVEAPELLLDGSFLSGLWQPNVGDCDNVDPAKAGLAARIVQNLRTTALQLTAQRDSACEAKTVTGWQRTEPVLLDWQARGVTGTPPRVCLWELGPNRCASMAIRTSENGAWTDSRALVTPPSGTRGLAVFLYADAEAEPTTVQFRSVSVRAMARRPVILALPDAVTHRQSLILDTTFSSAWSLPGSLRLTHTMGDGLVNIWIGRTGHGSLKGRPRYRYAGAVVISERVSEFGLVIWAVLAVPPALWRRFSLRRRRSSSP